MQLYQGCDLSCSICTGPSNNNCSSCKSSYFLQPSSTICLSTCPTAYYKNTVSNVCILCDTSCSACSDTSNTQCSACNSGYYLQPSLATCLSSCPPIGYYIDGTTNTCNSNHYHRLTCCFLILSSFYL